MVFPENSRRHYNVVNLRFNDPPADHVYDCTCGWCPSWLMPCRHVIAAAKGTTTYAILLVAVVHTVFWGQVAPSCSVADPNVYLLRGVDSWSAVIALAGATDVCCAQNKMWLYTSMACNRF